MRKREMTLTDWYNTYKPHLGIIEDYGGLPKGTISQILNGFKSVTQSRLDCISKGTKLYSAGVNVKLIKE
jgi:hypothetical protein